jgi:hypothetical protein
VFHFDYERHLSVAPSRLLMYKKFEILMLNIFFAAPFRANTIYYLQIGSNRKLKISSLLEL